MSAPLRLFNSLTRQVEPFHPIDNTGPVRVYSCGPTVYNYAHLGNLRAYVFTDTLRRALLWKGHDVRHVINITDVGHLTSDADAGEDKMERAAAGRDIWQIAKHYADAFKDNLRDLNIIDPSEWTVATDYVPKMIAFAERIAPAHCYELDSGLYFDTATVPHYGALAGGRDDAAHARIDPVAGKRNAADFAIWRKSPPGEQRQMEWDSPWGRGAPGWHLECSVMSEAVLGHPFDIHTGGIDHREIHHPNEIAQNQAFCDCADSGARFWMHNNFLVDRTGKMSKSSGEFLRLQLLIDKGFHPLAYRLMCLQAHYRSELEFSWEGLAAAFTRLKRMVIGVGRLKAQHRELTSTDWSPIRPAGHWTLENFTQAMSEGSRESNNLTQFDREVANDLGVQVALLEVDLVLGPAAEYQSAASRLNTLAAMDDVLGLNICRLSRKDLRLRPASATLSEADVEACIAARRAARTAKDFARSDRIRDELIAKGVEVMDGDPLGWEWTIGD